MDDIDHYGPQTEQIEDLIARIEVATGEQLRQIAVVYDDDCATVAYAAAAHVIARTAAHTVAIAASDAAYLAASDAAHFADTGTDTADAVADAAYALAIRHLISEDGFTWEHYRTLTDPVAFVLGALHPED
jgi:hypothetical protein